MVMYKKVTHIMHRIFMWMGLLKIYTLICCSIKFHDMYRLYRVIISRYLMIRCHSVTTPPIIPFHSATIGTPWFSAMHSSPVSPWSDCRLPLINNIILSNIIWQVIWIPYKYTEYALHTITLYLYHGNQVCYYNCYSIVYTSLVLSWL